MIPPFNLNGVLPPFIGATPGAQIAFSSPYSCTSVELVQRFATSERRRRLLEGLFQFRASLRESGIVSGFQWLDGSFTENVESDGREPNDIDVVTLAYRPEGLTLNLQGWTEFVADQGKGGIFDRNRNRERFTCDTFFLDLNTVPHIVARQAAYWTALFSHQRNTFQWKGMLALPLHTDDTDAIAALAEGGEDE